MSSSFFRDDSPRLDAHLARLRQAWGLEDWTDEELWRLRDALLLVAVQHNLDLAAPGGFRDACLVLLDIIRAQA